MHAEFVQTCDCQSLYCFTQTCADALPAYLGCVCSAREVQLTALSPVLSELAATAVPIPGLTPAHPLPPTYPQYPSGMPTSISGSLQQSEPGASAAEPYQISSADLVTVASFKPSVHVMSTKTRPKRIAMLGSDGRTYTFLLKVSTKSYYQQWMLCDCRQFATVTCYVLRHVCVVL